MVKKYESERNWLNDTWSKIPRILLCEDGIGWDIHYRRKSASTRVEVALTALEKAPHKAAYLFKWYKNQMTTNDAALLEKHRPGLAKDVIACLEKHVPTPESVTATIGKARMYEADPHPEKWEVIHDIGTYDGGKWFLAKRRGMISPTWVDLRLFAEGRVPHKASYYLGWNGKKFMNSPHLETLKTYRPEVFNRVSEALGSSEVLSGGVTETPPEVYEPSAVETVRYAEAVSVPPNYDHLFDVIDENGMIWGVHSDRGDLKKYGVPEDTGQFVPMWETLMIASIGAVPNKSWYKVGWNGKRFSFGPDTWKLYGGAYNLHKLVVHALTGTKAPEPTINDWEDLL